MANHNDGSVGALCETEAKWHTHFISSGEDWCRKKLYKQVWTKEEKTKKKFGSVFVIQYWKTRDLSNCVVSECIFFTWTLLVNRTFFFSRTIVHILNESYIALNFFPDDIYYYYYYYYYYILVCIENWSQNHSIWLLFRKFVTLSDQVRTRPWQYY